GKRGKRVRGVGSGLLGQVGVAGHEDAQGLVGGEAAGSAGHGVGPVGGGRWWCRRDGRRHRGGSEQRAVRNERDVLRLLLGAPSAVCAHAVVGVVVVGAVGVGVPGRDLVAEPPELLGVGLDLVGVPVGAGQGDGGRGAVVHGVLGEHGG